MKVLMCKLLYSRRQQQHFAVIISGFPSVLDPFLPGQGGEVEKLGTWRRDGAPGLNCPTDLSRAKNTPR